MFKFNYNLTFDEFQTLFYPDTAASYNYEKYQDFKKDFLRWFNNLNKKQQEIYTNNV
jgi:hypothetical protein